ncbi:unnamed protein product [Lymnaea stagnalis]|uniref:RBR-type E3 ubiquitin transferase n=1 Tax=Lymnaea stagnalis TaxID=6523 RepID=A0AAV2IC45_LYMST
MVLKKSNSKLNSGATQRVTRGCATRTSTMSVHRQQLLSLTLSNVPAARHIQERALQNLWDKLGWDGPLLTQFHLDYATKQQWLAPRCFPLSLNKAKRWLLPDRIKLLRSDTELLGAVLKEMELCVSERVETPNVRQLYRHQRFTASEIVTNTSTDEESVKRITTKSCRKACKHIRGVQRPHLFKNTTHPATEPAAVLNLNRVHSFPVTLHLELHAPYHVDVRCAHKGHAHKTSFSVYGRHDKKSSKKTKGCVKGRLAWRRGYSLREMREMATNMRDECAPMCEWETNPEPSIELNPLSQTFSLADFIIDKKIKDKRCRHKPAKEEECHDVGWKQKYLKGSFIVMPKEEIVSTSLDLSSWELVDTKDLNPSLSLANNVKEKQSSDLKDSDLSQNVQEKNHQEDDAYRTETFDFDNSFFPVELVMSNEEKQIFTAENCSEKSMEIEGFQIKVAESFPPSFVIHHQKPNNGDKEMESYIIGRKLDSKSSSWLISVQGDNCQKLRERMIAAVKRGWSDFPCLSDLIHIVLEIERDKIGSDFDVCSKCSISQDSDTDALWELLPKRPNVIICSAEKAYSYLQKHHHHKKLQEHSHHMNQEENYHRMNQEEHHHHMNLQEHHHDIIESIEEFEVTYHLSQNDVDKRTFECDVCYLHCDISINSLMLPSCRHMFCLSCWRRHLHHSIGRGATLLTCMGAQCTTRVDVTTAMTILPHTRIKQWLTNVRDKYLQVNPFCAWCPADACLRVAVSLTQPLRSQFGFPITCDCKNSWCSNCQQRPHWPASCDQMSAYNKLFDKLSDSQKYRKVTADFHVNLKPCPQCDYPIEKNEGCPHMVCTMCYFNFCWNCLKASSSHVVYSCRPNGNNFVTYTLTNELTHDLPLKYFTECLDVNKASRCHALRRWVLTLSLPQPGKTKLRQSFLSDCVDSQDVRQLIAMADECVLFSEHAFTLQESFYVLLSFIELQNSRNSRRASTLICSKLSQLQFITSRLQGHVVGKSVRRIFKSSPAVQRLLKVGHDIIAHLVAVAPSLQKISKNKDIAWVGALDPVKFMRYR